MCDASSSVLMGDVPAGRGAFDPRWCIDDGDAAFAHVSRNVLCRLFEYSVAWLRPRSGVGEPALPLVPRLAGVLDSLRLTMVENGGVAAVSDDGRFLFLDVIDGFVVCCGCCST